MPMHRMADPLFVFQRPSIVNTLLFSSFPQNHFSSNRRRLPSLRLLPVRNNCTSPPDVPRIVIVSTTELSDGSVLFRFGDESEMAKEKIVEEEVDEKSNNSVAGNHRACHGEEFSGDNVEVVDDRGTSQHRDSGEAITTSLESKLEGENSYATRHGGKESMNKEEVRPSVATMDEDGDTGNVSAGIPESVHAVDLTVETDRIESSEKIDDSVASSNSLDEINDGDANRCSTKANSSVFNAAELPTTRSDVSSGEEEEDDFAATLFLSSGAASLPHPSKALTGCEDAYFVTHHNWLGIADGAGQWSLDGINAGLYTHELMSNCKKTVTNDNNIQINNPVEALKKSVTETETPGSSTTLIAYFNGQVFHVANIGDTGFIIIRNSTVLERSSPIHHEFNFPVHIERGDDPSALVEEYKINLEEDDVIVTATDGLFDNIYEPEIASTVLRSLKASFEPQEIAEILAAGAQEVGRSKNVRSPFADAAQAAGYIGYTGGKLDNVTVIVSLVRKKSSPH